jgi:hypothetical protein
MSRKRFGDAITSGFCTTEQTWTNGFHRVAAVQHQILDAELTQREPRNRGAKLSYGKRSRYSCAIRTNAALYSALV